MGFSRQECWSGLPCPPPENLSHPGMEPPSLMSSALTSRVFTTGTTWGWKILFPLCLVPPGSGGLSTCAHLLHPHLGASCQYGPHRSREHGCFCFHGQSRNHASQEAVHVIALSLRGLKNCQGQSIGNPGFLKPCSNLLSLFWTDEVRERKKRG